MPRKCCVPGRTANYDSQSTYTPIFLFPKNEERRKQWISAINRIYFIPGSSAVVCMIHFDERVLIKEADLCTADKAKLLVPEKGGMLSRETEFALSHTTRTLIYISKYVLENLQSKYILLGKFQTDSLEARFGQYRQMNGGNYNISFRQVIESDKKLKILSLMKLHSTRAGEFSIKSLDYSDAATKSVDVKYYEEFSDVIDVSTSTRSVLIFIAGYVISCTECISTSSSNDMLECESPSDEVW